jgi:hypothetical protein
MSCLMTNGICPIDDLGTCCHKEEFKVVAVIPVKGRWPLLKHTIERLYKKNGVHKVVCVGDPEEKKFCESLGAEYVIHRNKPLGAKWNTGFVAAKKYSPHACLFVGSSDWLSDNWLSEMGPHIKQHDLVGTAGCFFLDIGDTFRLVEWPGYKGHREGESIGIGRLISKQVLDKLQWKPFDDHLDSSLDFSMIKRCNQVGGKSHLVVNSSIKSLSISTNQWGNKHKFEDHWSGELRSRKIFEVDQFIESNFPEAKQVFNASVHQ